MIIEKDWRALIGMCWWAWLLGFLPLIPKAIAIATTEYSYDNAYTLTHKSGLISKTYNKIDLRRLRSISATDSPFQGGSLVLIENNGATFKLPYIKNADNMSDQLRRMTDYYSRSMGDVQNRIIA